MLTILNRLCRLSLAPVIFLFVKICLFIIFFDVWDTLLILSLLVHVISVENLKNRVSNSIHVLNYAHCRR